jgi:integrase
MVKHCLAQPDLVWLGEVIIALASIGLRISELASLRWSDFDFGANVIRLTDTRQRAAKKDRDKARSTKSHEDRSLPIRPELRAVVEHLPRHADGRVFHGPLGGLLKPDTVRNILIRDVIEPLSKRFRSPREGKGFGDGRLHSLRHYFCSMSAANNVPEQILMSWLGHRDSKMVRHYYHLHDAPSQQHMARTEFFTMPAMNAQRRTLRYRTGKIHFPFFPSAIAAIRQE